MSKDPVFGKFCERFLGQCCCLLPEGGTIENVYGYLMFGTCPEMLDVERKTARKYLNGGERIPHYVRACYVGEAGLALTCEEMAHTVEIITSITRARIMQQRVHDWLSESGISAAVIAELDRYYVPVGATREQIAIYLAHIRHQTMAA